MLNGPAHDVTVPSRIRILVADESLIFREALVSMLRIYAEFEVVAAVAGRIAAVRSSADLIPDVAIVDLRSADGSAVIAGICAVSPRTRVIVLSGYDDRMLRVSATAAGAKAYLVKGAPPGVVAGKVREVARAA